MGRTAPLTSKSCISYIYSTNVGTEYFKHALYSPFFFSSKCSLFHNANLFGSCIIHILYTGCVKIKKNNSGAKWLNTNPLRNTSYSEYCIYKLGCIPKCSEKAFVLPAGVSGSLFTCSIHPSNHRLSGYCLPSRPGSVTQWVSLCLLRQPIRVWSRSTKRALPRIQGNPISNLGQPTGLLSSLTGWYENLMIRLEPYCQYVYQQVER